MKLFYFNWWEYAKVILILTHSINNQCYVDASPEGVFFVCVLIALKTVHFR